MAFTIRRVDYFYAWVEDQPGQGYNLLTQLADVGINLLAFAAVPVGPLRTQLTLFPEDTRQLQQASRKIGLRVDGPHPALLVQGDDKMGALAEVHARLAKANVNVYASTGVTDGKGSYGYVLYVRPEEYERATATLSV